MFGDDGRSTATVPPPPRTRLGRRSAPADTSPQGLPTRRRWGRFAAGAVLALLGAWVFATLYVSAGKRVEVLALARDVDAFDPIEEGDLRTVLVAADESEVDTVDAGDRDDIVGLRPSTALLAGQLLPAAVPVDAHDRVIAAGDGAVAIEVEPSVAAIYEPGQDVGVVVVPPQASAAADDDTEAPQYDGWIASISDPDEQTRTVTVEVVLNRNAARRVAAASDRIKLISFAGFEKD
jgi:hypothetical protein